MAPTFSYSDMLPIGPDTTKYRLLTKEGVSVEKLGDKQFLHVTAEALTLLTETAMHDISHYLRSCLLYTSPSPRDRQKSRMPSSA